MSSGGSTEVAAPVAPAYSGLASGAVGKQLDVGDRSAANKAEFDALNSGERKTWRGGNGAYGYAEVGPDKGACRDITHTVYINGRPQVGHGVACRDGGGWKLNG